MTKLLVAGCSHTEGLVPNLGPNFKEKTWGAKLANKLDAETFVNKGRCSSSNDRIIHTLIKEITGDNKPDVVVVQFTYVDRFMAFDPSKDHICGLTLRPINGNVYNHTPDIREHAVEFIRKYYNVDIPEQRAHAEAVFLTNVLMVQETLKSYGIEYYFLFWDSLLGYTTTTDVSERIDWSRVLNKELLSYNMDTNLHAMGFKFSDVLNEYGFKDCHFTEDCQEFLANAFYDLIVNCNHLVKPVVVEQEHVNLSHFYG